MIFNLFKSKPTLKELIPEGYVDIHSHILPGIDDGPKNPKESIKLISEMGKMGFSKIIATPHTYPGLYDNTKESIKNSFEIVQNKLRNDIIISYASEYMLDVSIIDKSRNKKLLCIKDNYVLVEMSFFSQPLELHEIIYEVLSNGYKPILAHPERYLFYNSLKEYYKLKKFGCLFQVNLLSATDYYGKRERMVLDMLLKNEMVDFIGSDIHNEQQILCFNDKIRKNDKNSFEECLEKNNIFF